MSRPAGRRAFPDTSVLYPLSLLDLLMSLEEDRVHALVLSEDLLGELDRKWSEGRDEGRRAPSDEAARAAFAGIRRTFADAFVSRDRYVDDIDDMPGNDPDDKPHTAAAVAGGATHLITNDQQGGFPADLLSELGLTVQTPDDYLAGLAMDFPDDVAAAVIARMAYRRSRRQPDLTPASLLGRWRQLQLDRFCNTIEAHLGS